MFKNNFLLLLMAICLPAFALAQNSIDGKVFDHQSQNPLPWAHVSLDGTQLMTVSDLNGYFKFGNLKSGNYTLIISYLGYETSQTKIEVPQQNMLKVEMQTKAFMEDEVIISATRATERTGTTYQNIGKAELKKADLGKDLPYILNLSPSLVSTSDAGAGVGYTSVRIRGTDISRINVTLNGIPMNDAESQGVWWVNMPDITASLNSIQIQRGIGTSSNGAAAFGASINMLSNAMAQEPSFEFNSAIGSFNTSRLRLAASTGLIDGKWTFDTRLSKVYSDGYVDRASSDLKSFFVSAAHYSKNAIIRINVFSGKEKTYQSWYGVPKDSLKSNPTYNPYTYENQIDNYQQDHYQLHYLRKLNSHWNLNAALHYTKGRGYYESWKDDESFTDYGLPNPIIGLDTITNTNLVQQKWLDNDFYGATFSLDFDDKNKWRLNIGGSANQYIGNHFGKIIWAEYASMPKDYEWYRNQGVKNTYNLYVKTAYQISKPLSFYGDLLYRKVDYSMEGPHDDFKDLTANYHFNFINPKAGFNYHLTSNHKTYFSIASAKKEPSRSDFRDADLGKTPKSELLIDYELGYSLNIKKLSFSANAFWMDYTNQLVLTGKVNNVGNPIMTNVESSYRAGVELIFSLTPTKWFNWNANVSLSQNKISDFTEFVDNWDTWSQDSTLIGNTTIAFSPSVVAANQFQIVPFDYMEIMINTKYVGKQYIDNTSNDYNSLSAYSSTDLVFHYTIKSLHLKKIGLSFSINNLFNAQYAANAWIYSYNYTNTTTNLPERGVIDGYYPQAGTNFMLGLDLKF
jgi:iron complex outermembrane receptor protein